MQNVNLNKYCQEAHEYFNQLTEKLGHPYEGRRAMIIWRAVMHSIRDRIHIGESFDLISQLPLMLKGLYVENWKFHEKPPMDYHSIEEMKEQVKKLQHQFGEMQFDWDLSTEEIISITLDSLKVYLSDGQIEHIKGQMPADVKSIIG